MRKGQVTLFIILGIIIVSIIGTTIYFRDDIISRIRGKEILKAAVLPDEIKEVDVYVKSCISDVAKEGIDLLERQGGFIKIEDSAWDRYGFYNNLKFANINVPYWFYKKENGVLTENVPTIDFMEESLSEYLNNNLMDCLDFSKLNEYEIANGEIKSRVQIKDDDVDVNVELPLYIRYREGEFILADFKTIEKTSLGILYKKAKELFEKNSRENYLEEKTIDMLVLYDELPLNGIELNCLKKRWLRSKVEDDLRKIVERNVALIRIKGTDYRLNGDRQYFEFSGLKGINRNLHVNFMYFENWPLELEVEPSENDVLEGQSYIDTGIQALNFLSSIFCLSSYHFVYDIRYPVLVMLEENGETFQFALQVIIDNNQPKQNKVDVEVYNTKSEICENAYGTINVYTLDEDNQALANVDVSYKCLNSVCKLKVSDKNGYLRSNVVQCVNGALIGEKEGYYRGKVIISTNTEKNVYLNLEKYYDLDVDVLLNGVRGLNGDEGVLIIAEDNEKEFRRSLIYPENNKIELISGKYHVKAYVTGKNSFNIKGDKIEKCVELENRFFGLLKKKECFEVEVPSINLDRVVKGGSEFDVELSNDKLEKSEKIIFNIMADKLPSSYDELQDVYDKIKEAKGSVILE